jgi:predicted alpha/beta-hydrolase family hydrolase
MSIESRKLKVDAKLEFLSVWAIPENYETTTGRAIILAHGAGNDMHSSFVSHFHHAFAEAGLLSIKFNFPYTDAGRKVPDRMELLENTWRAVIKAVRTDSKLAPKHLFLAGKSMGGRVASHVVAQGEPCDGLIFLGYPLHPAKQTEKLRIDHWSNIHCPTLFVEGARDSLCDLELLKAKLPLIPGPTTLYIVEGGDHSFKVPKSLGKEQDAVFANISHDIIAWLAMIGNHNSSE